MRHILPAIVLFGMLSCSTFKSGESGGTAWFPVSSDLVDSVEVLRIGNGFASIFPAEYDAPDQSLQNKKRFTPSPTLLRQAEPYIQNQFSTAFLESTDSYLSNKPSYEYPVSEKEMEEYQSSSLKWITKLNEEYPNLYRQYIGYYSENGDQMLMVQFLDFSEDPNGWKDHFHESWVSGWHGWYYSNIKILKYNVNKFKLSVH